jgi:hypothetical protein
LKQKIVGIFEFGYEQVQLVLREGTGGEFYMIPEAGSLPRIKVGAHDTAGEWGSCLATLLHEVFEFAMLRADARFSPDHRVEPKSHADYLFVMDHEKFQVCCAKSAEFLVKAVPALSAAFNAWHKPPRRANPTRRKK